MLLTAAIIVRDEADHLDACLTSLRGVVDEIVVVDTGSRDDSVAVARRHGAVTGHHPWNADFSAARNHSLDLASGEWILYIDADERVRGDADVARAQLARGEGCIAYRVRFVPRVGWTAFREFRLWRNLPDVRFVNPIHESIVPALQAAARRDGLTIEPFDLLTIDHFGYEGDQAAKRARDEPMLLAEIERNPQRAFLYDHLARVYEGGGDSARAIAAWQRGIEIARARDFSHLDDQLLMIDLFFHLLAQEQVTVDTGALIDEAARAFGALPPIELAQARYEFATGRPEAALPRLEWLVACDPDGWIDTGNSYDRRVFGVWAWDLLGLSRFALGDDALAAEAFRHAEAAAPGVEAYAVRRRLAEARAAQRS